MTMDRWERNDWWGVVLDAPDVAVLTRFYSELRGWPVWKQDAEGSHTDGVSLSLVFSTSQDVNRRLVCHVVLHRIH